MQQCTVNTNHTPAIEADGLYPVTKLIPVQLAQTSTQTFNVNGWLTGSLIVDPSIVAGVVMAQTVTITDYNNTVIFKHTFKQAFTINIINTQISSISVSESSSATYVCDLLYQIAGIALDEQPPVGSISYFATAPFVIPKASESFTHTLISEVQVTQPTSGAAITFSITSSVAGGWVLLYRAVSAITVSGACTGFTWTIDGTSMPTSFGTISQTFGAAGVMFCFGTNGVQIAAGVHSIVLTMTGETWGSGSGTLGLQADVISAGSEMMGIATVTSSVHISSWACSAQPFSSVSMITSTVNTGTSTWAQGGQGSIAAGAECGVVDSNGVQVQPIATNLTGALPITTGPTSALSTSSYLMLNTNLANQFCSSVASSYVTVSAIFVISP